MLAAVLVAGGVVVEGYVTSTIKPLPASSTPSPAPPTEPKISCQLGQLLIMPNCYPLQPGDIDLNLNIGNKFSTPGEMARLYIVSGAIRINDIYNSSSVRFYNAGETIDISPSHIVTATQQSTRLQKRVW
jgi:hypothetical protein